MGGGQAQWRGKRQFANQRGAMHQAGGAQLRGSREEEEAGRGKSNRGKEQASRGGVAEKRPASRGEGVYVICIRFRTSQNAFTRKEWKILDRRAKFRTDW